MSESKTCGECRHFAPETDMCCLYDDHFVEAYDVTEACDDFEQKKPTNGDCIRSLSNEELAMRFAFPCPPKLDKHCNTSNEECHDCWLNWLNAPAKEETENNKISGHIGPAGNPGVSALDVLAAELEELRYIVEQFSRWTAEGGCVKANFPDFPCWWERNRIELELDDYCDSEDEIEHKCWVEYYRWKFRQKNNTPDTEKGGEDEP